FSGVKTYRDVPLLVKTSLDEKWDSWARKILGIFSQDMLYEESLKIRVQPKPQKLISSFKEKIHFSVTLGEMDRILTNQDKLDLSFNLKLSKNYLRSLRNKWKILSDEVDAEGKKEFHQDVAQYLAIQLKGKEKLFSQKMWNEDFSYLIAKELVQ